AQVGRPACADGAPGPRGRARRRAAVPRERREHVRHRPDRRRRRRLDLGVAMRMLLLGPPGGGKGTQGARLSAQLGVAHIAVGDLLRQEVSAETPLGVRVAEYMTRGELVPDELIIDALTPRLVAAEGFILDG